jgi:hypothetical protein
MQKILRARIELATCRFPQPTFDYIFSHPAKKDRYKSAALPTKPTRAVWKRFSKIYLISGFTEIWLKRIDFKPPDSALLLALQSSIVLHSF